MDISTKLVHTHLLPSSSKSAKFSLLNTFPPNELESPSESIKKLKQQLRTISLTKRLSINKETSDQMSQQITANFFKIFQPTSIGVLHTYIPMKSKNEPNTLLIADKLASFPYNVPIINPTKTDPQKHASVLSSLPNFRPTHIIVPLLTYDKEGTRIGFGAGYYDKFLKFFPNPIKIGVSFFPPSQTPIPKEPHDIKLDYCVTPNKVYNFTIQSPTGSPYSINSLHSVSL